MTVIAGMVDPASKTVVLGADSLSSSRAAAQVSSTPKILTFAGDRVLLGITGSWRYADAMRYALHVEREPLYVEDFDAHRWAVERFVPAMRDCLQKAGAEQVKEGIASADDGGALLAVRDRLFLLSSQFGVTESAAGWDTHGAGHAAAAGALFALAGVAEPEQCVVTAIEAACDYVPSCAGPVRVKRTVP